MRSGVRSAGSRVLPAGCNAGRHPGDDLGDLGFRSINDGDLGAVNVRKLIQKRIRGSIGGATIDGDVNAAVAANVGERGAFTEVSSTQHVDAARPRRDKQQPRR